MLNGAVFGAGCILSKFYIKPQQAPLSSFGRLRCILSKFYIKPQHRDLYYVVNARCILSKFYIKPQRPVLSTYTSRVVSYRNSTSNHNTGRGALTYSSVVSYRNSTSNHNGMGYMKFQLLLYLIEILHQTTTG